MKSGARSGHGRFPGHEAVIDGLLASPDHASHLAAVLASVSPAGGVELDRFGGVAAFETWLEDRFGDNTPYDQIVREILLAEGRVAQAGPLLFYTAAKLEADRLAARTARVFLGMRLECAQCHDDPFEPWTQEDFWSFAAYFARISRPRGELEAASTVLRVKDVDFGEVMLPETTTIVAPRLLDGTAFDGDSNAQSRRQQLVDWLTAAENPFFARATVTGYGQRCLDTASSIRLTDWGQ